MRKRFTRSEERSGVAGTRLEARTMRTQPRLNATRQ
jgi:hypothetical protein